MKFNTSNHYDITGVEGQLVEVPFVKAFAAKVDKTWYVYEYSTGLKLHGQGGKTLKNAIEAASKTLNSYGKEKTEISLGLYPKIND